MLKNEEIKKEIIAIDLAYDEVHTGGIAYYRLDKNFKEFLSKCNEEHGIVGFKFEDGSWNFGVILKKETTNPPQL